MLPFQIGPNHVGYHLDRCEEVLLIDAWLKIRARIADAEAWAAHFEDLFFGNDKGVSEKYLENIERHLRRLHLKTLDFQKSGSTPYMKIRFQEKMDARHQIREDLKTRPNREPILEAARAEMRNLPAYLQRDETGEDPTVAAQRRKESALERARQEQDAQRDAEFTVARQAVVAAEAQLRRVSSRRSDDPGLFGHLEALLVDVSAKVDLILARSELDGLQMGALMRRVDALEKLSLDAAAVARIERSLEALRFLASRREIQANEADLSNGHALNGHHNGSAPGPATDGGDDEDDGQLRFISSIPGGHYSS